MLVLDLSQKLRSRKVISVSKIWTIYLMLLSIIIENLVEFSNVLCLKQIRNTKNIDVMLIKFEHCIKLKVGCLHPVACTRSGSGFPSNATLV
jgi:hypothetical protein